MHSIKEQLLAEAKFNFNSKLFYFILILFFIHTKSLESAAADCNCVNLIRTNNKIIDSHSILTALEQGNEKVKIIVNLKQPDMLLNKTIQLSSPESLQQLHKEVKESQDKVIKNFNSSELILRQRFENQSGFSCEVTSAALDKLLNDPNIDSIEPVYILEKHLAQGIPLINGLVYRSVYNGGGVAIAICDSGVDYTHLKLGGGGFPNSKVIGGYDFGDSDSDPFPTDAHGTACAGIAAGDLGNTGDYIGGVACGAKIYALKTENSAGVIYSDKVIASWDWCTSHKNDDPCNPILVISTSIGGARFTSPCDSSNSSYANAANNATAAGITLFVSTGNDGYCDSLASPSCIRNVISVGAVYDSSFGSFYPCVNADSCADKVSSSNCSTGWYSVDSTAADKVASYSNIADFLDLLAPANLAYTTDIAGAGGYSSGDYDAYFGGTSAACPYAAGAAACLQSAAREITGHFLSPQSVRNILSSTGDAVTDSKSLITKPRVNLAKAIERIMTTPCADIAIGTGTSNWDYPLHTANHDSRTQVIYLASEVGSAGVIKSLALYVNAAPGQTMNRWTIRMKHTSLSSYSVFSFDSSGWTTAYQANEPAGVSGWRTFVFSTPFAYNGNDNLLVDFSLNNASASSSGQCKYTNFGSRRSIYAYSNSTNGDPLNWSKSPPAVLYSYDVPDIVLNLCPLQVGDFQPDGIVDKADLAILAAQWLQSPGSPSADIAPAGGDGIVNFLDFCLFAQNWLEQ